jgi:hypothetical protein
MGRVSAGCFDLHQQIVQSATIEHMPAHLGGPIFDMLWSASDLLQARRRVQTAAALPKSPFMLAVNWKVVLTLVQWFRG